MASNLDGILDALEAMSISGYSYTVLRGSTLKTVVDIATTPCRIISAIGVQSSQTRRLTFGSGAVMRTEWTIQDVALIRPASLGIGLMDIAPTLEGYLAAYHEAIRSVVASNSAWVITDVSLRSQVLEWPAASGQYFDAVVATLTASDIVQ
jgi:hypothetical protein